MEQDHGLPMRWAVLCDVQRQPIVSDLHARTVALPRRRTPHGTPPPQRPIGLLGAARVVTSPTRSPRQPDLARARMAYRSEERTTSPGDAYDCKRAPTFTVSPRAVKSSTVPDPTLPTNAMPCWKRPRVAVRVEPVESPSESVAVDRSPIVVEPRNPCPFRCPGGRTDVDGLEDEQLPFWRQ